MARNDFVDRLPTFPGRYEMTRADGSIETVTLVRDDEATVEGTKLNAESLNKLTQFEDFSNNDFNIDPISKKVTLKGGGGSGGGTDYKDKAMIWRINNSLTDIIICYLGSAEEIDTNFFDGSEVVESYYDSTKNEINKTGSDTVSFCTPAFSLTGNIVTAAYSIDGTGTFSAAISFDNGGTWTEMGSEKIKISKSNATARLKISMTGECLIKNFCWGVTKYE